MESKERELKIIFSQLEQAVRAEDIFGDVGNFKNKEDLQKKIKDTYYNLAQKTHPDHYSNDPELKELATDAFNLLQVFYSKAEKKIDSGIYGIKKEIDETEYDFLIKTPKQNYHIKSVIAQGELSQVYGGYVDEDNNEEGRVVVKIIDNRNNNHLMQNEFDILTLLKKNASRFSKHIPIQIDQFETPQSQLAGVFKFINGYNLYQVLEQYQEGVPLKIAMSILSQSLMVLSYVHSKGIIHGNINPSHIMLNKNNHNVYLIDWSYAIVQSSQIEQEFDFYNEDFSALELREKKILTFSSDIFSLGKTIIFLLRGDVKSNLLADSIDNRIINLLHSMVKIDANDRPQDVWELYKKVDELREELYGSQEFIEMKI